MFADLDESTVLKLGLSWDDMYFLDRFCLFRGMGKFKYLYLNGDKQYVLVTSRMLVNNFPILKLQNDSGASKMLNRLCERGKQNKEEYPLCRIKHGEEMYYSTRGDVLLKLHGME